MSKFFYFFLTLKIIIIKCDDCDSFDDCYNCTSNYENNCVWNINKCETDIKNYNQDNEWWKIFLKCGDLHNNIYCGKAKIKDIGSIQTLSLIYINDGYGIPGLLCSYSFEHNQKNNELKIEFTIKKTDYNNIYPKISMKIFFTNKTSSLIDLKENQILKKNKVENVEIYVLNYEKYISSPFIFSFETKNSKDISIRIFIIIISGITLLFLIFIIFYICKQNKNRRYVVRRNVDIPNINVYSSNRNTSNENINTKEYIDEFLKNYDVDYNYLIEKNRGYEKCSICLDIFKENKNKIIITPCDHIFHHKCLKEWLNKNQENMKCPNCNYILISEEEIEKLNLNTNHNMNYSSSINNFNNISRFGNRRTFNINSERTGRIIRLNSQS